MDFVLGILMLILIPAVPHLMEARIRFLRRIGWSWGASVNEYTFAGRLLSVRFLLVLMAGLLFYSGWTELGS